MGSYWQIDSERNEEAFRISPCYEKYSICCQIYDTEQRMITFYNNNNNNNNINPPMTEYSDKCSQCSYSKKLFFKNETQECKNCFTKKILSKFKYNLSKNKILHTNSKILVVHSDEDKYSMLHYLVKKSIKECSIVDLPKKVYFLYIDDNVHKKDAGVKELKIRDNLSSEKSQFQFEYYRIHLSDFFEEKNILLLQTNDTKINITLENSQILNNFGEKMWDNTAKQEVLSRLRNKLVIKVAKKFNCNIVLLNDLSIDLSAKILSNMILGKGIDIPYKYFLESKKDCKISFYYPMQSFTRSEVKLYSLFFSHQHMTYNRIITTEFNKHSIQEITSQFLFTLNRYNNLSTLAVCNLAQKIHAYDLEFAFSNNCALCNKPVKLTNTSQKILSDFILCFSKFISKYEFTCIHFFSNRIGGLSNNYCSDTSSDFFFNNNYKNVINLNNNQIIKLCYSCIVLLY